MMSNETSLKLKSYNNVLSKKIMKYVCNIFAGGTPSTENKSYWNGHINWIPSGLVQDCVIDEKNVKTKITNKGLLNSSAKMIKPDSALLAITGATCGKSGYLPFSACANQSVMAFEPYTYSARYIYYLFQKNKNKILKFQAGGAQAGLNKESCENLTFLFHEEAEQKQIAGFLSNVDSLLEEKKKELEKTKQFKQTMLSKMFPQGDSRVPEIRFNEFKHEWKCTTLDEQKAEFFKGYGYSKNDLSKKGTQLFLYGRLYTKYESSIKCIDTFTSDTLNNSVVSEGNEIVVPSSGETAEDIARASAILSKGIILGGGLNIFRLNNKFDNRFIALTITYGNFYKKLTKKAQGKTVVHIYNDDLKDIPYYYPDIKEQRKIADFFDNIADSLINQEKEITNLEHLKTTLLNKMFA